MTAIKQDTILSTTIGEVFQHRLFSVINATVSQDNIQDVQKELHLYFSGIVNEEDARYLSSDALFGIVNGPRYPTPGLWGAPQGFRAGAFSAPQNTSQSAINLSVMIYDIGESKLCIEFFTNAASVSYGINPGFQNPTYYATDLPYMGLSGTPHPSHFARPSNPNPFGSASVDRTKSSKKIKQSEMLKVGEVIVRAISTENNLIQTGQSRGGSM